MYSLWSIKKLPINEAIEFIRNNSSPALLAQIIKIPVTDYYKLSSSECRNQLLQAISSMSEDSYDHFLLEIIDE